MNKDVVYIEAEDDITDIITKIEKAKEKIVALVPPKKAGVLRSIVNIKLIAKTAHAAEKTVVLVTVDPSITKLAAAAKIPVAANLQTAPAVPKLEEVAETKSEVEELEANLGEVSEEEPEEDSEEESEEDSEEDSEEESADEDEGEEEEEPKKAGKKNKKEKKSKSGGNKFTNFIKNHKKLIGVVAVLVVALVGFLVWAFGFAPAVDISVAIQTESKNFSEKITLVSSQADEDIENGKFYIEQKKIEVTAEAAVEATGQKNLGEKATGSVVVYAYFPITAGGGEIPISVGTIFTINGLNFVADTDTSLEWDGDLTTMTQNCENGTDNATLRNSGCLKSARIAVTAEQSGATYNISKENSGWTSVNKQIGIYSDYPMEGGTDDVVTVVQQSDVEKAKASLTSTSEEENKEKLYATIDEETYYIIESSFSQETAAVVAEPGIDEEIGEGVSPKITATTTISVYVVDKVHLEQYLSAKAKLEDGQKIYEIVNMYLESFSASGENFTAKLKAKYYVGPKITESELVEKILGKGLGDARREISDVYGVAEVTMNPSYPWVMSVPSDSNKVSISFSIKDEDGNEVKDTSAETTGTTGTTGTDDSDDSGDDSGDSENSGTEAENS